MASSTVMSVPSTGGIDQSPPIGQIPASHRSSSSSLASSTTSSQRNPVASTPGAGSVSHQQIGPKAVPSSQQNIPKQSHVHSSTHSSKHKKYILIKRLVGACCLFC